MDKEESAQLNKMHDQLGQSGISAFDTAYLERYTKLLTKSLKGKSDAPPTAST